MNYIALNNAFKTPVCRVSLEEANYLRSQEHQFHQDEAALDRHMEELESQIAGLNTIPSSAAKLDSVVMEDIMDDFGAEPLKPCQESPIANAIRMALDDPAAAGEILAHIYRTKAREYADNNPDEFELHSIPEYSNPFQEDRNYA